ncbi:MAG: hypothetical protein KTR33_16190 [Gammaproteobacteria bacterium]|nr:hypothetical protein [Gammaproteobacteria bacterium]
MLTTTAQISRDWHAAASALVDGFNALDDPDDRIGLTEKLCDDLGGHLYPAFLQILYKIEQHADSSAKSLVTSTLVYGLNTGRLPSGKLSAWGASTLQTDAMFGQSRTLGPIEYLCTWYAQPSGQPPMTQSAFSTMANSLLRLVDCHPGGREMYCTKLLLDAEDPLSGSLASSTRSGLAALANQWQTNGDPTAAITEYLHAIKGSSMLEQLSAKRPD